MQVLMNTYGLNWVLFKYFYIIVCVLKLLAFLFEFLFYF